MRWKNWPYWVGGGMFFAILTGVWYGIAKWTYATEWFCPLSWSTFCRSLDTPLYYLIPPQIKIPLTLFSWRSNGNFTYSILIILMVYYFLIGGIIGWLYGKIRNRSIQSAVKY